MDRVSQTRLSMINAPTIVRLVRFPESLRLEKKGNEFRGPLKRSGAILLSERHDPVVLTFRLNDPALAFATGGDTITRVEAFNEGEQRDLLLPWALVAGGKTRPAEIVLEIDVHYEGSAEKHTATVPLALTYGVRRGVIGAVAAAAAAVAITAAARSRRKTTVVDDDEDVELSLFNIASTSRTPVTSAPTNVKGAKVKVVDEEDVDVAVYNVGTKPATRGGRVSRKRGAATASAKKASAKKASAKKASTRKASAKKAPARKATARKATARKAAKKQAPAKKGGGARRGSSASRSAPRKGVRGSSAARKSASRRSKRKSR